MLLCLLKDVVHCKRKKAVNKVKNGISATTDCIVHFNPKPVRPKRKLKFTEKLMYFCVCLFS
jgi:hypothetical protein